MSAYFWLCAVLVLTPVIADTQEDIGVANDYIDEVLNNLRGNMEIVGKIDPLRVPDFGDSRFQGRDIWIKGLSTLHRSGDCTISYDGNQIGVVGHIAVNNIRIELNYKAKALFWISGIIRASLNRLAVKARLSVDQDTKMANLQEFRVTEFGHIKIDRITGLSVLLNWLLKIIAQNIVNNSKSKIIDALETGVADLIRNEISKIRLPIY